LRAQLLHVRVHGREHEDARVGRGDDHLGDGASVGECEAKFRVNNVIFQNTRVERRNTPNRVVVDKRDTGAAGEDDRVVIGALQLLARRLVDAVD